MGEGRKKGEKREKERGEGGEESLVFQIFRQTERMTAVQGSSAGTIEPTLWLPRPSLPSESSHTVTDPFSSALTSLWETVFSFTIRTLGSEAKSKGEMVQLGNGACCQAWLPKRHPWGPHDRRRELIPDLHTYTVLCKHV